MADSNDLRTFYKGDLEPRLVRLDRKRREIARGIYIASAVGLILAGIGFWLSIVMKFNPIAGVAIPIVLTGLVAFFLLKSKWTDYLNGFKKQVIAPIVEFIDPALDYSADRHIRESTFKKSGIFRGRIDRYHGDDLVSGVLGKTEIEFSEIHAEKKHVTHDSKGRRQEHWETIFRGLFFRADFNKHFKGETYVLTDGAFGFLGKSLQSIFGGHGDIVHLEDPEFEKAFVVYGSDQIEARYILSPGLMKRMTRLRRHSNKKIQASFFLRVPGTFLHRQQ